MRRPGHEDCEGCPVCGLTHCPDCDTTNRYCDGLCDPSVNVDKPAYRPRPRKKKP